MSKYNKEERIARLFAASEQKKQHTLLVTEKAIKKLQQDGRVITFKSVAREAGVSTSYLYKYSELKEKILRLREEQKRSGHRVTPVMSDDSKNRIVVHLKKRVKDLEQELIQLKLANESLAGRAFELEKHEEAVERFRKHNEKLSAEIERLVEENTELKNQLARRTLKSANKVTPIKRPTIPISESVKVELEKLNIKINSTLKRLIRENPEEIVLESIAALKYALGKNEVENKSGFLVKAIKYRWKEPESTIQYKQTSTQHESDCTFSEGFEEWFIEAIDSGFIVNESPLELPKNTKGELLVKVNLSTASGLPYSQMSWVEAKKIMNLNV
ncbi:MAG: DUF6262 family protein [Mastigocoleus sp. MO_167.B18]|nr:DUF6262 family protein [Mastigocoleus sp. MO_167.B18]